MIKDCPVCNKQFNLEKRHIAWGKKYCSNECVKMANIKHSPFNHLSTGTVGAMAELLVSTDLMKKGFEVYRALSPSSSCDVLAIRKNKLFRFEVRTGSKSVYNKRNSKVYYAKNNFRADFWAIVIHDPFEIVYIPELPKE